MIVVPPLKKKTPQNDSREMNVTQTPRENLLDLPTIPKAIKKSSAYTAAGAALIIQTSQLVKRAPPPTPPTPFSLD